MFRVLIRVERFGTYYRITIGIVIITAIVAFDVKVMRSTGFRSSACVCFFVRLLESCERVWIKLSARVADETKTNLLSSKDHPD